MKNQKVWTNKLHEYYVSYAVTDGSITTNKSVVVTLTYYVGDFKSVKRLYHKIQKDEQGEVFIYGFTHLNSVKVEANSK